MTAARQRSAGTASSATPRAHTPTSTAPTVQVGMEDPARRVAGAGNRLVPAVELAVAAQPEQAAARGDREPGEREHEAPEADGDRGHAVAVVANRPMRPSRRRPPPRGRPAPRWPPPAPSRRSCAGPGARRRRTRCRARTPDRAGRTTPRGAAPAAGRATRAARSRASAPGPPRGPGRGPAAWRARARGPRGRRWRRPGGPRPRRPGSARPPCASSCRRSIPRPRCRQPSAGRFSMICCEGRFGFGGLVYTDSMSMAAVARMVPPDEGAVRAFVAGADQVLHPPDPIRGLQRDQEGAVASGRIAEAQIDASVTRVLRAKASVGLHVNRAIDLDAVPANIGGRTRDAVAQEAFARAVTLVKDDRHQVPLTLPSRRVDPLSVGARLSVGMADRGAEPHLHSGAEKALAAGHLDRGVRSHADVGARCRARRRAALTAPWSPRCSCDRRRAAGGSISVRSSCAC